MSEKITPDPAKIRANLERMDKYVCAALTGMLSNHAWNSPDAQNYMRAKRLTIEQLAVAAAMEALIQVDKFLKGEVGGENDPEPDFESVRGKMNIVEP